MANEEELSRQTRETLIECARRMRKTPTEAEAFLWEHLRKEQLLGFKFRRQHIIRTFIVDFYCPACKLVIEIDGPIHMEQLDYDLEREAYLSALGYQILRFNNQMVIIDVESVLEKISQMIVNLGLGTD